ncbi:MAG: replication factor C small subunit [Candidatus Micrarchaeota archaeon]|nr:replication factor C small subunit [Candidatus Micrarchaeota archaeon]
MVDIELWTEKYRPQKLSEVVGQKHVIERLMAWVKKGSIPNMMFAGPAGVGKTTIALALAKELFGNQWKENFQETNASDERGINVVRGKIKDFARTMPLGHDFKIVFLDESDALTPEAQQALRRTMEKYAGVCRFILSCNYSSHIIEPIQSRCAVFRFKRLSENDVKDYMQRIANAEGLHIDDSAYKALYEITGGDLRTATNILQATSALGKITAERLYETVAQARPEDIRKMLDTVLSGDFKNARQMLFDMLINQGLSGEDVIKGIYRQVFEIDISEELRRDLIEKIAEYEFRIDQGGSPEIQLEALLSHFIRK